MTFRTITSFVCAAACCVLCAACSPDVSFSEIFKGDGQGTRSVLGDVTVASPPSVAEYVLAADGSLCLLDGTPVTGLDAAGLVLTATDGSGKTVTLDASLAPLSELSLGYGMNVVPVVVNGHDELHVNATVAICVFERAPRSGLLLEPLFGVHGDYAGTDAAEQLLGGMTSVPVQLLDGTFDTLTPFSMGRTAVTYRQWRVVYDWATAREQDAYEFANKGANAAEDAVGLGPVTEISLRDARVWCNAASEMDGRSPVYQDARRQVLRSSKDGFAVDNATIDKNADGYRLPTATEWQFAARGGLCAYAAYMTNSAPWSTLGADTWTYSWPGTNAQELLSYYVVYDGEQPEPVARRKPNAIFLYDLCGNVAQWTDSADSAKNGAYAVCGGDCYATAQEVRIDASPRMLNSADVSPTIGFRVVCASREGLR